MPVAACVYGTFNHCNDHQVGCIFLGHSCGSFVYIDFSGGGQAYARPPIRVTGSARPLQLRPCCGPKLLHTLLAQKMLHIVCGLCANMFIYLSHALLLLLQESRPAALEVLAVPVALQIAEPMLLDYP